MDIDRRSALRVHNVRLIDGVEETAVPDAVLEADDDGRITYAGPAGRAPAAPRGIATIDGRGGTLLPGFFDCHVHLGMPSNQSVVEQALMTNDVMRVIQTVRRLRRTLESGITSARDLGALPAAYRDAVTGGELAGPRLQVSVGIISHTGGHADSTLPSGLHLDFDFCVLADDVREVRLAARRMLRDGADVIKICTTGGISSATDDPDDEDLLEEEVAAAVDEARRHGGRPVAAHAQGRAGILTAIRGGVRSVEHGFGIDDQGCDLLGEREAFLVPTLQTVFRPLERSKTSPWRYEKKRRWNEITKQNIAIAIERKVNIAAGTDAGITPHGNNLAELAHLVELGMTPMDAIRAATVNSARMLEVDDRLGSLRPGMLADLVICAGDPLQDINLLSVPENIVVVAQQGVVRKNALSLGPSVKTLEDQPLLERTS
ncbi:amidohydrolase family protein [Actinoplanes sp. NBRC 103695]|uniref:metal-dependent hydrolase family protein n=1 Tax=Actinoplanes sp. NBRC 103695 TaxID=3032202 RepID=UPI0025532B6D|nr:amidohydrolase family protein [Actinoplanes sp. NBRC 103695]